MPPSNRLPGGRVSPYMDNNTEKLSPYNDFWKGVLVGGTLGILFATYAYYVTDFQSNDATKGSARLKPPQEKQTAA